jgi:hypothetical protein
MKKIILILAVLLGNAVAQNVRYSVDFPIISSTTSTPYLVAAVPPNSPVLAVCSSPAVLNGSGACINYVTTYTSTGVACPSGAQDTPDPQPSSCQSTGDAQGNIGFWIPPGKYDYTVCVQNTCFGPYTITAGGVNGGFYNLEIGGTGLTSGDTVNFNNTTPAAPLNGLNVQFASNTAGGLDSVSAAVVGDGLSTDCLLGIGSFGPCPASAVPVPLIVGPSSPPGISVILWNGPDPFCMFNSLGLDQLCDQSDPATGNSALAWNPNGLVNQRVFTTTFQSTPFTVGQVPAFDPTAGNFRVGAPVTGCQLNSVAYVGGACTSVWGSGDIGANINAAYAALPSTGGAIYVIGESNCYNYSTPIVLATPGKYLLLNGLSAGASTNSNPGGACLNFTPTTSTCSANGQVQGGGSSPCIAITADWTPLTGGGIKAGSGINYITLTNGPAGNACGTNFGCSSTALGLALETTNAGVQSGLFLGDTIQGFGVGLSDVNSTGGSYGMTFINLSLTYNTTGAALGSNSGGVESFHCFGCYASVNATGWILGNGEYNFVGGAIESQSTIGVSCIGTAGIGQARFYGIHWENLGTNLTANYVSGPCNLEIIGGIMLDDNTGGSLLNWMLNTSANHVNIDGLVVSTVRTAGITSFLNASGGNTRGKLSIQNNAPASFTNLVGGSSAFFISNSSTQPSTGNPYLWTVEGPLAIGGTSGGTNASTILTSANTGGTRNTLTLPATVSGTVLVGLSTSFTTTAATTDNVTVTGMTSSGHCQLQATNSGAAGGIASVYVSAKTTNQITVTHTATSGWIFDVLCTPN